MAKQKHSGMAGVNDTAVVVTANTSAYDHKSNSAVALTEIGGDNLIDQLTGAPTDINVVDVDWKTLGLNPDLHGPEVTRIAHEIMQQHDFDPNSYGSLTNYEANTTNTNRILDSIASSDMTGAQGKILGIVTLTKDFSREVTKKPGFFTGLLGLGKNKVRDVREKYDSVSQRLDSMIGDLNVMGDRLKDNSNAIHELEEINKKEYHACSLYIAAGRIALNETLLNLNSVDQQGHMVSREFQSASRLYALEKRLHDLESSQVHRRQQAYQYRLIIDNNKSISDKLISVTTTLLPAWRSGITTALAIQNVQSSAKLIDAVQEASDQFLLENSQQLRTTTTEVARLSQRGLFDVNVLMQVQQNIEATAKDVVRIQSEGSVNRAKEIGAIRDLQANIDAIASGEIKSVVKRLSTPTETVNKIDIESRVEQA